MITVADLKQTCESCPSQWEGRTDDGQFIYIRYRWGSLEYGIGESLRKAVLQRRTVGVPGGQFEGTMPTATMKAAMTGELEFSDE